MSISPNFCTPFFSLLLLRLRFCFRTKWDEREREVERKTGYTCHKDIIYIIHIANSGHSWWQRPYFSFAMHFLFDILFHFARFVPGKKTRTHNWLEKAMHFPHLFNHIYYYAVCFKSQQTPLNTEVCAFLKHNKQNVHYLYLAVHIFNSIRSRNDSVSGR